MIDYIGNFREVINNVLELLREFSKVVGFKINIKNVSGIFVY